VVFKNPSDASQIVHLAKQAYPGKVKAVQVKDATSAPFSYLLFGLQAVLHLTSSVFVKKFFQT